MPIPTQVSHIQLHYSRTIGRSDQAGHGFSYPQAAVRGPEDTIYVLSRSYEYRSEAIRVTVVTLDEEYVMEFARGIPRVPFQFSSNDGSLAYPTALAFDKEWNVYIADEWLNRITIFSKDGDYLGKWGKQGSGDGELRGPSGLAFDQDDNLLVVDSLNHRVQRFTREGNYLGEWGSLGTWDGKFNMPWGIDTDREGDVYVADWRNDRIQKFSPEGEFLMKFGSSGTGDGEFRRPCAVAVDKDGMIYVVDWLNERVQVFDQEGSFATKLAGNGQISRWGKEKLDASPEMWKERELAPGLEREKAFRGPAGIDIDDQNRIFIVEALRGRIQVYRKLPLSFLGSGRLGG